MLNRFVIDGGVAAAWQWDSESQFCLRRVRSVAPIAVVPVKGYYGVETLRWLEDPPCCNEEVTPAIDAFLNGMMYLIDTFRLDESTTTTTLPPPVPRSTRPLRRNSTTLVKHNLLLSINIRHPHRLIGHGDINKTISQLLVDPLTPCLQRSPTKHHLRRASSSRRPLIIVTNNQKNSSRATI